MPLPIRTSSSISCILDIRLDYYQEDFHQPPEFLSLRKLLAFMGINMPGSDLENQAQDWGGRAGDRVGHTDPASVQLGWEHRVGSHPIPTGCSLGRPPRALALTHVGRWEECP